MNDVQNSEWSDLMKQRFYEDDRNLKYAENTVNFYYYFSQAILAKRDGNLKQSKQFYQKSIPFAKGLKAETEIVQTASSHANAKDGLDATRVDETYLKFGKKLGVDFEN